MKENALYPNYFNEFNCIADECKNTCCAGWSIEIDKQTFKKYRNSNHPILKGKHKELFNKKNNRTYMKLDENLKCTFLDEKNLCSIHKELGERLLCDTCKVYPRVFKKIDSTLEVSLSASCEAAAKLILENKEGLSFISGEQATYYKNLTNQDTSTGTLLRRCFWPIRVFIIEVLQYRDLSVEERLTVIGLFINKLQNLETEFEIEELIEHYSKQMYMGLYKGTFNKLKNYRDLLKIQINILNSLQLNLHNSTTYKHLTSDLNKNLTTNNFNKELYIETYESFYKEFILDKQYIIENYLVNVLFNIPTVFDNFETLKDIYIGLVIRSGLIKNIITNTLISNKDLTCDELILLISKLSRIIDHSKVLRNAISQTLKINNFDSTSNLLVLTV